MELNPNHPVTSGARDQWHKIAALIMIANGQTEIKIGIEHVLDLAAGNINIVLDARGESKTGELTVRLVDDKTANQLAAKEGGRNIDN